MRMNFQSLIYRDFYEVPDNFVGEVETMAHYKESGRPSELLRVKISRLAGQAFVGTATVGFGVNTLEMTCHAGTLLECRHKIERGIDEWLKEIESE